jgi:hypothetical protein
MISSKLVVRRFKTTMGEIEELLVVKWHVSTEVTSKRTGQRQSRTQKASLETVTSECTDGQLVHAEINIS